MPKVMVKQYGTDIVLMVESGAVKINDDYYAEVMWGGGGDCRFQRALIVTGKQIGRAHV